MKKKIKLSTPIGMKKALPTFLHQTALELEDIAVSGGMRGLQIILSPKDLISFTNAKTADLTI